MNKTILKDHRDIGRELDLFSFHEYAPGAVFWHPKGWKIYQILQNYVRAKTEKEGYVEVSSPVMVKNQLFKESGHWEHFGEQNMFNLPIYEDDDIKAGKIKTRKLGKIEVAESNYSLKPMNCPESAIIFKTKTRSYHDLPLKIAEYGILHRRELSGVLGGTLRVRQFVIDDAHLYVREDQIQDELVKIIKFVKETYKSLKFEPRFFLATRPQKAMGNPKTWKEAEKALENALKQAGESFKVKPKDGAFYGPKIDIHIYDSQKRDWQLATIQLDFQIPQSMKLEYIDKDGIRKRPSMIHRGIFGSIERFIGILLEHTQGKLPTWISPVQAIILPITSDLNKYADSVYQKLISSGVRTEIDSRRETLQAKIRALGKKHRSETARIRENRSSSGVGLT